MIDIFESIKIDLRTAGLSTKPVANKYYKKLPYLYLMGALILVPPSIDFVLRKRPDLAESTHVIYVIVILLQVAIKFVLIWSRMDAVHDILRSLQSAANESEFFDCLVRFKFAHSQAYSDQQPNESAEIGSEAVVYRRGHSNALFLLKEPRSCQPELTLRPRKRWTL